MTQDSAPALRVLDTAIGELGLEATATGVCRLWLPGGLPLGFATVVGAAAAERILDQAERELDEYFAGERRRFDVPLDWSLANSGFAGQVQRELSRVPYAETATYGEVAELFGHPRAARAVGSSCAKNPLPIFSPCHRIVRSGGQLGNYGGSSGTELKRELLDIEQRAAGRE